jgi:hypothetical protein
MHLEGWIQNLSLTENKSGNDVVTYF